MEKSASADEFVTKHPKWRKLLVSLRSILNSTELEETIKWGVPVYTLDGKNAAFENLAPYKKREYAEHLSNAKREETRARRLEKIIPMILAGKGLNDRYRR